MTALILLLFARVPVEDVVVESVDLIEVNHTYDGDGRHVFDQVLFYDWCAMDRRFHLVAWRLLRRPEQIPYREPGGQYVATWIDEGTMRQVRSTSYRETWTQYDPEVSNRALLSRGMRRELVRPMTRR